MTALPTLRRKILRSFSVLVMIYAILGALLVASVLIASKTTPRLIHLNYDSIAAATKMEQSWSALQFPDFYRDHPVPYWNKLFEDSLVFAESNITEPGEKKIADSIRADWNRLKTVLGKVSPDDFMTMRKHIADLTAVNEHGMFGLAQYNEQLSDRVLIGSLVFFFLSLVLSVVFADQLSQRLSRPIKSIVEAIHSRSIRRRLKLPVPTSLEMLILTTELGQLWERLAEADRINVAEVVQERNKLETLLSSVEDALLVLDSEGQIIHCSDSMLKLIGLSIDQIQGNLWRDLPTMNENYLKLRDVLREGMPESQEIELLWNQHRAQFSARSRKIEGAAHRHSGLLYLLHDITEKRQREKFRSDFIDLLSHELKTPLQSLGTAVEILIHQKKRFPDDLGLMVDTVSEDVERIRAVALEFVQITQSQSKVMKLKLEPVALNQVLPEWLKPFSVVAKDREVKLEVKHEGSEILWANLDLVKFPWVISNIVSNAVRFSPSGGTVTVLTTDRNGSVEVRICDEGPGVPEADEIRIFEPFYQSRMTSTSGARGLFGVGLTIAKEVVEAHDGRIEYHRLQPHGSEFRILLPFPPLQQGGSELIR